ncbi:hypothetical protein NY78_3691 [Desulfovibrio sp. TomC]|nr:hypothetical protein NY78_3691 [Desulfovibrio sp. TomC]
MKILLYLFEYYFRIVEGNKYVFFARIVICFEKSFIFKNY